MPGMQLVGYVDRWSALPGETLTFHVSSAASKYRAELVRLIHGDDHPDGPGFKEETVRSALDGEYPGIVQDIPTGSCVKVDGLPALSSMSFCAWVWPTLLNNGEQYLFSRWDRARQRGCALSLCASGTLVLRAAGAGGFTEIHTAEPVAMRRWLFVAVTIDAKGSMSLHCRNREFSVLRTMEFEAHGKTNGPFIAAGSEPLLLGAAGLVAAARTYRPDGCFNGKLGAPLLFDRALTPGELRCLADGDAQCADQALARWDFVAEASSTRVPDISGNAYHGQTLNRPTRLVTGPSFCGRTLVPFEAPVEFNAAHFHEDDLADAGWEPAFRFTVPAGLRSGIYAARITAGEHCDHIPFVVRGNPHEAPAPVALLLPTVSYAAYANSRLDPSVLPTELVPLADVTLERDIRAYVCEHNLLSLYDHHSDGSGVCTSTMLRPMPVFVRPRARSLLNGGAHQLGADLHIVDWLEMKGIPYEVITDHDLDREGVAALRRFNVVISGTHAEYWTGKMLDALQAYQESGGRFMYLGGNGLYWVTALSEDGTIVEMRRVHGTRSWNAEPGEGHLSLSGEPSGLWRHRARAPQRYVGVGFSAQGFGPGRPYLRRPESNDPRARFIFAGVEGESIGDFPVLVSAYGAAGFEVDRADPALGTPEHALILATATHFSDCYQNAIEEVGGMTPDHGGTKSVNVRADMVFYETPADGAVFATGSIAWCSGLSHNNYDNDVSRITENVVRAFARPGSLARG